MRSLVSNLLIRSFFRSNPCRRSRLCPAVVAGLVCAAASGYGQATVTVNNGAAMSLRTGVSMATFADVTPTTFAGTTYTFTPSSGTNGTANFSGLTASTVLSQGNLGSFVTSSVPGQYTTPDANSGTFLAVGGSQRPGPVSLTFSNAGINYLGLEWATPDATNSLTLTFKNGTSTTYTPGSFALAVGTTNSFVEFTSTSPITRVSFASSAPAFELDNVTFGVVPEPATWMSGGLVLLAGGVVVMRRRRFAELE